MERNEADAVPQADIAQAGEQLARLVDQYVMAVTEGLCALEHQAPGTMQRPGISARRTCILEHLELLDGLMGAFRDAAAPPVLPMPSGAGG